MTFGFGEKLNRIDNRDFGYSLDTQYDFRTPLSLLRRKTSADYLESIFLSSDVIRSYTYL